MTNSMGYDEVCLEYVYLVCKPNLIKIKAKFVYFLFQGL